MPSIRRKMNINIKSQGVQELSAFLEKFLNDKIDQELDRADTDPQHQRKIMTPLDLKDNNHIWVISKDDIAKVVVDVTNKITCPQSGVESWATNHGMAWAVSFTKQIGYPLLAENLAQAEGFTNCLQNVISAEVAKQHPQSTAAATTEQALEAFLDSVGISLV